MAYCRFASSDVYLFHHAANGILCMLCRLADDADRMGWSTSSRQKAIRHLEEHREAGDEVPDHAFERLREEIGEEGDIARPAEDHPEDLEDLEDLEGWGGSPE